MSYPDILVIGCGIYGLTAALELGQRGYGVAMLDPGPLPHPLAASTDISKVIRMEYGPDEQYMVMVEQAREGWLAWNELFGVELYHEIGVTMMSREVMVPGRYEYESYQQLLRRGHRPERLNADELSRRFPAWKPGAYQDGFFHAKGGYAESGRVIEALLGLARQQGITIHEGQTASDIASQAGQLTGVRTQEGGWFPAGQVVVAAGSWTPVLLPELSPVMRATGHPVFHLRPSRPEQFSPPHFTVFNADVARTGWYGFPFHPTQQVVKIANHGLGQRLDPVHDTRLVGPADEQNLRHFLAETFPDLVEAPIVYTRRCLYCDTLDEHFWIDRHPERPGVTVTAGGSGHGFKFGPVLGPLVADALEGKANPWLPKFQWRTFVADTAGEEPARYHG